VGRPNRPVLDKRGQRAALPSSLALRAVEKACGKVERRFALPYVKAYDLIDPMGVATRVGSAFLARRASLPASSRSTTVMRRSTS